MDKPTQAALDAFAASFPDDSRAERRKMFDVPAGFINGNMFMAVFTDGLVFRLPDAAIAEALERDGVGHFEPTPGRPWKAYIQAAASLPAEGLSGWARAALDHTAAMPPKVPKPRKPRKA